MNYQLSCRNYNLFSYDVAKHQHADKIQAMGKITTNTAGKALGVRCEGTAVDSLMTSRCVKLHSANVGGG